jgi:hypothetical protein
MCTCGIFREHQGGQGSCQEWECMFLGAQVTQRTWAMMWELAAAQAWHRVCSMDSVPSVAQSFPSNDCSAAKTSSTA